MEKITALTMLKGIEWIPTTIETDLTALTLISEYGLTSIFNTYYAATNLLYDPDRIIESTNSVYDRIPGLSRVDPRDLARRV